MNQLAAEHRRAFLITPKTCRRFAGLSPMASVTAITLQTRRPQEIADAVAFLSSPRASYINGANFSWQTVMTLILSVLLAAAMPTVTLAASNSNEAEVRTVARAFDAAQLAKEGKALDRFLADDLVFVRGSGVLAGKKEFIAAFTAPGIHFDPITILKPTYVQLGPDAGIVGGETTLTGVEDGVPFSEHIRYANTFHRVGDTWKVVHVQVTMVK